MKQREASKHEIMGKLFEADGSTDQEQWDVLRELVSRENLLSEALKVRAVSQETYDILWIDHDNDKQAFRRYVWANKSEAERLEQFTATETGPGGLMMGRKTK